MEYGVVDSKFRAITKSVRYIVSLSGTQHEIAVLTVFIVTKTMAIEKHVRIAIAAT